MAAVTICSDFGAPQNKVWHCFHCFPIYFPWSDGTRTMIFIFWTLSFKPTFSLFSFTFIKRLFSSSRGLWGHIESDMTEWLTHTQFNPCITNSIFFPPHNLSCYPSAGIISIFPKILKPNVKHLFTRPSLKMDESVTVLSIHFPPLVLPWLICL